MAPTELEHYKARAKRINSAQRIVVKVGSSQIVSENGAVKHDWLKHFCTDIACLLRKNKEIIVVSSGASALSFKQQKIDRKRWRIEDRQAAAAIGQPKLINYYSKELEKNDIAVAQLLLTLNDTESRRSYLNARATIRNLISQKVLPIINENDSVSTTELRYGDNDRLAARVAIMVDADLLVILSDVDGLYNEDPRSSKNAQQIDWVESITDKIKAMAKKSINPFASGGMSTKLDAARIAQTGGVSMIICHGDHIQPLAQIYAKQAKMSFFPRKNNVQALRKKWIATTINTQGAIIIDAGASKAVKSGKSLLPAGVLSVTGGFIRGDIIELKNQQGDSIGLGLSGYDSNDCKRILGKQSSKVAEILGRSARTELIHCDDLVITNLK